MKLNSGNRHDVEIGDILAFSYGDTYIITAVLETGRSVSYSLQDIKTKQNIYCLPSSHCYGAEIIKTEV